MIILCPEIKKSAPSRASNTTAIFGRKGMVKKGFLILVITLASIGLKAQSTLEAGVFGGVSYYLGDINPVTHFSQIEPAYGVIARYNISTRWTVRFSATTSELAGDDLIAGYNEDRALNFITRIYDGSLIAEFNFFDYFTGSGRNYVSPYLLGGVSFFHFNPKDNAGNLLRPLGTEGQFEFDPATGDRMGPEPYSQFGFSIPFGIGVKYSLTKRLGLAVEWRMHKTFTDYIDDISTVYYQETTSPGGTVFEEGMLRGDRNTNDWFNFTGITLTYKFNLGQRQRCLDQDGVQNW